MSLKLQYNLQYFVFKPIFISNLNSKRLQNKIVLNKFSIFQKKKNKNCKANTFFVLLRIRQIEKFKNQNVLQVDITVHNYIGIRFKHIFFQVRFSKIKHSHRENQYCNYFLEDRFVCAYLELNQSRTVRNKNQQKDSELTSYKVIRTKF